MERVADCLSPRLLGRHLSGQQRECRQAQEQPYPTPTCEGATISQHRAYFRGVRPMRGPVVGALVSHTATKDPAMCAVMGLPSMDPNGTLQSTSWSVFQTYAGTATSGLDLTPYIDVGPLDAAIDSLGIDS